MFTTDKVTDIFFMADEFHKVYCRMLEKYVLNAPKESRKKSYHRDGRLSVSEVMTIMILFHNFGYRYLKHFCLQEVCVNLRHLFPQVVSYNRFVELEKVRPSLWPCSSRRCFGASVPASVLLTPLPCVSARTSFKGYLWTAYSSSRNSRAT